MRKTTIEDWIVVIFICIVILIFWKFFLEYQTKGEINDTIQRFFQFSLEDVSK